MIIIYPCFDMIRITAYRQSSRILVVAGLFVSACMRVPYCVFRVLPRSELCTCSSVLYGGMVAFLIYTFNFFAFPLSLYFSV